VSPLPAADVVKIGDATLYHGDALELLRTVGRFDAVITDPPYGQDYSSNFRSSWTKKKIIGDADTRARDAILGWIAPKPAAVFGTWKTAVPSHARACLVWDKGPASGMGDLTLPWKQSFELIYVVGRGWRGIRHGAILRGPGIVTWETRGRRHPTQKPVWLLSHFLQKLPDARVVLDPFMGSGSTGIACAQLGIGFIGIEKDRKYFEVACERLVAESRQGNILRRPPAGQTWSGTGKQIGLGLVHG
jgi:16S rRNA G966 N2-methylase RsmD